MRRVFLNAFAGLAICFLFSIAAQAGKLNPADFPLRVHIFTHNGVSHYYDRSLEEVDGEGRANLYENGEPHGFDYSYHCSERLINSIGYDTYLARWKKPGRLMEIYQPLAGRTCELKVDVKPDMVYRKHNGVVNEEPASVFKSWMVKHQYDPEHGLSEPVKADPDPPAAPGTSATPEPPAAPKAQ